MSTKLEICNMALSLIGAPQITSLTEESEERRICTTFYDLARDEILSQYPWHCCLVRDTLSPLETDPEFEWSYQFTIPSDCLKIKEIYPDYIGYKVEQGVIYSESDELQIVYHQQVTDTSKLKPHVVRCIVTCLAAKIAFNLIHNATLQKNLNEQLYNIDMPIARGTDVFEGTPPSVAPETWLNERL